MGEVKYTRVRAHPGKPIKVCWTEMASGGGLESMSLDSKDLPRPDLYAALNALRRHLAVALDLPQPYMGTVHVVEVLVQDKKGEDGIRIVAQKGLDKFEDPLTLISPKIMHPEHGLVLLLNDVWLEAAKYVVGKRAQGELFTEEKPQ